MLKGSRKSIQGNYFKLIVLLALACITLLILAKVIQGTFPNYYSNYNSYTLQALQWRKGEIALTQNYQHLELAIYDNRYFVSFPPVPTVPVFLLSFIFGANIPETILVQLYALLACLLVFKILEKAGLNAGKSALWAFLLCFASSFLNILQDGAVWYQAQSLSFLLSILAIERMQSDKPTQSLFFFALSVGCRPFQVLYGPLLLLYYFGKTPIAPKHSLRKLASGIALGFIVAISLAWYNYVRFGNIFEFGHNYLPEFSSEGGTQFALEHLARNISVFFFGWPFHSGTNGLVVQSFGFSLFLSNPIFICFLFWIARDIYKRKFNRASLALCITMLLHLCLLLSHRTFGGYQFGARYVVDLIPYVIFYFLMRRENVEILNNAHFEFVLLLGGFMLALAGTYLVHF